MAETIFKRATVELIDGTEVNLRPLSILGLRELHEKFDGFGVEAGGDEVKFTDQLIELTVFCLQKMKVEWVKPDANTGSWDAVYERLDLDTALYVLEICGGIKFRDPNLMNMLQILGAQEEI